MKWLSYLDKREVLQQEYSQPRIPPSPKFWWVVKTCFSLNKELKPKKKRNILTPPFRQPTHPCLCLLLTELKLAFSLFDRDKDGNISMAEVRHVMNTLGQRINDRQLQAMFKQVDLDGKLTFIISMLKELSPYYTMRFRYFALAIYPNANKTLFFSGFFSVFFFSFRKIWIMKLFSQKNHGSEKRK